MIELKNYETEYAEPGVLAVTLNRFHRLMPSARASTL